MTTEVSQDFAGILDGRPVPDRGLLLAEPSRLSAAHEPATE